MIHNAMVDQSLNAHEAIEGGLTELVLTGDQKQQMALIMPMVAHLSKEDDKRWITWITDYKLDKALLESFGVNTNHLRLVHCHKTDDQRWISWEALTQGNSHTVIASPGKLTEKEFCQLENAAIKGACQGILLRSRQPKKTNTNAFS